MGGKSWIVLSTVVSALGAGSAAADQHQEPAPAGGASEHPDLDVTTWQPGGVSFAVGGGVGGYIDSALTDRASGIATAYDIRGVFGTDARAAIELAHFGLVQRFELDIVDDVRLLTMGLETAARVNFTVGAFQPYLLGGIGWTHANLLGQAGDTAAIDDRKNLLHFPLGGGCALYFGDFVLDIRAQARLTTDKEASLFRDIDDGRLGTWAATAQIGWHP
ncbi:MAG: hypothetical protein KJO07_06355 [Deltaproteobacteria bacterium]|nr:hypothetical protein [Deltaproteobacteria bacterium]